MKQFSEVIVIGSGIIGAATVFALTRDARQRVTLLEKGPLTSGMTRRNAGLVHPFHSNAVLAEFALASHDFFNQWAMHLGGKTAFVETGAVSFAQNDADAQNVSALAQTLLPLTNDAKPMQGDVLTALYPGVTQDFASALFTPRAGYADAVQTAQAMVKAAQDKGLHLATGTMVKQILVNQGQVQGVKTTTGDFNAPVVIVAAGNWSERLLAPLGIAMHLQQRRGAVLFYEQPANLTSAHPMFLDARGEYFLRPHPYRMSAAGFVSNQIENVNVDSMDEFVSPTASARVTQFVAQCLPDFQNALPKRGHTIVYDALPDGLPALGRIANVEGLFVAAGFGTSAFSVAPAVGDLLARWVMDSSAPRDLALFRPGRI